MIDINAIQARLGSISPAKRQAINKVCPAAMKVLDDVPALIKMLRDYGHPVTRMTTRLSEVTVSSADLPGDFSETLDQHGGLLRDRTVIQATVQQKNRVGISTQARPDAAYQRHPRNVDGKPGDQSAGTFES